MIDRLVVAFQRLPGTPVYSPTSERIEAAIFDHAIDGADLIVATGFYLGFKSLKRYELLAYARALGRRRVARLCREEGRSRATLYRRATAAAETVARGLNRDRRIFPPVSSQNPLAGETTGMPS